MANFILFQLLADLQQLREVPGRALCKVGYNFVLSLVFHQGLYGSGKLVYRTDQSLCFQFS